MSRKKKQHFIVEHIWRAIRALLLISALLVWIAQDGISTADYIVIVLACLAHLTEQLHGWICRRIERLLGWAKTFKDWE